MKGMAVETKKRKKLGQKERSKSPKEVAEPDEDHQLRERVRVTIKGVQKGMPIVGITDDQVFNNDPV
jgi:hypothetical protein